MSKPINSRQEHTKPKAFKLLLRHKIHFAIECIEYLTVGSWHIEGNFLITFTAEGHRVAYAIPNGTISIIEEHDNG